MTDDYPGPRGFGGRYVVTPPTDHRGHVHRHPTGSPFYHDECDITDRVVTPPTDPRPWLEGTTEEWDAATNAHRDRIRRVQIACDRCTQGVMDQGNDHLHGRCRCACHKEGGS